jgi:hypothetical protein
MLRFAPFLFVVACFTSAEDPGLSEIEEEECKNTDDLDSDGSLACDDCNDEDPYQKPGQTWYADADEDGFGDPEISLEQCETPDGYVIDASDCDDDDPEKYPGQTWYVDSDGDGYANPDVTVQACEPPEGFIALGEPDCNDIDPDRHETNTWYRDVDEDGYGDPDTVKVGCDQGEPWVLEGGDCNDDVPFIHPDAFEICNGLDDDCDDIVPTVEIDADGDGWSPCEGDANDTDPDIFPIVGYPVGGATTSNTETSYFRGNVFVGYEDNTLMRFEMWVDCSASCSVDIYVHEGSSDSGPWTVAWSDTLFPHPSSGPQYLDSGPIGLDTTSGVYYGLGMAWNCSATFYSDTGAWSGHDTGIGNFVHNYSDDKYSSYSSTYNPKTTGSSSTAYDQIVYMAH